MSLTVTETLVKIPGQPKEKYIASDGREFFDIDEAVEYENKISVLPDKRVIYEQVWTIQQAINMAVAENRVVRFLSNLSNKELRKGIVDKKGCKLLKKDIDGPDIAILPPGVDTFDFDEVK